MARVVRAETFASLEAEWRELLPHSRGNTIFATPYWLKRWWGEFGEGKELLLLAVEHPGAQPATARLSGIAPLMIEGGTVYFLGSPDLCDYLDFVPRQGEEEAFYAAVWEHLAGRSWGTLDLHCLSADSLTLHFLPGIAERSGCAVERQLEDVCPAVDLPVTWEEYLAALTKKDRHELRRKFRRLSQKGFRYYSADGCRTAQDADDFLGLQRKSSPEKARFLTPQRARFFRALCSDALDPGQLRLYFLEVEGVRVSAALCFDYDGKRFLYNSGYDPAYSSLSVGLLLKALCLKDAIAAGHRQMDFLRGEEPYKYDLGARDRPLYRLVIRRGTSPA